MSWSHLGYLEHLCRSLAGKDQWTLGWRGTGSSIALQGFGMEGPEALQDGGAGVLEPFRVPGWGPGALWGIGQGPEARRSGAHRRALQTR